MLWVAEVFLLATTLVAAQDPNLEKNGDSAPYFDCPETSGKFADSDLCDKFYICRKGVATIEFCPEGLLFDTTIVNHEKCVFPHKVDCGDRNRVQITSPDIDNRCKNANGIFDWSRAEEVSVCDKYIQCDDGRAFEFPCAGGLVFDVTQGTCVRPEARNEGARFCDEVEEKSLEVVDGFSCPAGEKIGPQGLKQAHPIYPHDTECQSYFVCFNNKIPNKFGCSPPTVFDPVSQVCVDVDEPKAPSDCRCFYECPQECPFCNLDCSCPSE